MKRGWFYAPILLALMLATIVKANGSERGIGNPPPGNTTLSGNGKPPAISEAMGGAGSHMLPDDSIELRNSSNKDLLFYVLDVTSGAGWQLVSMTAQEKAMLRYTSLWVAIGTSTPGVKLRPISEISIDSLNGDGDRFGGYAILHMRQKQRYEMCWVSAQKTWSIFNIRQYACP